MALFLQYEKKLLRLFKTSRNNNEKEKDMYCKKNPNRPTQPAICSNCRRKCELAGKRKKGRKLKA